MTLPRRPAGVVFDMDGLLFETEALYHEAMLVVAAEASVAVTSELFMGLVGRPWMTNRRFLLDHLGPDFDVDAFGEAWSAQFRRMAPARLEARRLNTPATRSRRPPASRPAYAAGG